MTLLVGVLCRDGAVIAADRQVTHGAMGNMTVGHPGTKVQIIKEAIFASSGAVGLGQQIAGAIEGNFGTLQSKPYHEAMAKLQAQVRALVQPAFDIAKGSGHMQQVAMMDATCGWLLAMKFGDGMKLVDVSPFGGIEHLSETVPFVCVGSGKQNADPFLHYIWELFWPDQKQLPTMRDAILAAYWTVTVVTKAGTTGVGMGCDVFCLEQVANGKKFMPKQLPPDKLAEHESFIEAAENSWRELKNKLADVGGEADKAAVLPAPEPAPPPPPAPPK